jgi:hypothetical protein
MRTAAKGAAAREGARMNEATTAEAGIEAEEDDSKEGTADKGREGRDSDGMISGADGGGRASTHEREVAEVGAGTGGGA